MLDLAALTGGHVQRLAGDIGARPCGSAANHAAAAYIRAEMTACGLEVETQPYPCPDWALEDTILEAGGLRLPAKANPYSPACDLSALAVACSTRVELEAGDAAGRILILYGALASRGLIPPYACYISAPDPLAELLKAKRPAALVCVGPRLERPQPLIEDWEIGIPSVTVPAGAGLELLRRIDQPLRLLIASRSAPGESANVVGRRAGTHGPDRLVFCAHYDTKHGTPGALDNASGVAVLLALARLLAERPPKCGLEFIAFSGEETGGTDFTAYMERAPDLEHMLGLVNVDGVGLRVGADSITLLAGSAQLEAAAREIAARYPGATWIEPWYESDHSAFAWRGVPSFALSTAGAAEICHQPEDTPDWVDPDRLARVVELAASLAELLQGKSLDWTRPPAG
jgi:aminopeptidase YwaD